LSLACNQQTNKSTTKRCHWLRSRGQSTRGLIVFTTLELAREPLAGHGKIDLFKIGPVNNRDTIDFRIAADDRNRNESTGHDGRQQ